MFNIQLVHCITVLYMDFANRGQHVSIVMAGIHRSTGKCLHRFVQAGGWVLTC